MRRRRSRRGGEGDGASTPAADAKGKSGVPKKGAK